MHHRLDRRTVPLCAHGLRLGSNQLGARLLLVRLLGRATLRTRRLRRLLCLGHADTVPRPSAHHGALLPVCAPEFDDRGKARDVAPVSAASLALAEVRQKTVVAGRTRARARSWLGCTGGPARTSSCRRHRWARRSASRSRTTPTTTGWCRAALSSGRRPSSPVLTRTSLQRKCTYLRHWAASPEAPRTVRTGYAYQPGTCRTYHVPWHPRPSPRRRRRRSTDRSSGCCCHL